MNYIFSLDKHSILTLHNTYTNRRRVLHGVDVWLEKCKVIQYTLLTVSHFGGSGNQFTIPRTYTVVPGQQTSN